MDNFWIVTLFHYQPSEGERNRVEELALSEFEAMGIEEYSLNESEVDAILGERSYSGGDLPESVLDEVELKVLGSPRNYRFFFSNETNANLFLKRVKAESLCESQLEQQRSEDWNAEWKKHYKPIKINESFEIIPSWETEYISGSAKSLYLYPGMGFGTGSHETTFLCLKLFTENLISKKVETVLDFGSGSGILGLSVFKFFPEAQIDFYDIDPEANKNCFQNAEVNKLEDRAFRLLLPEVREKLLPSYDVVFANILESILLQECENLIKMTKVNGYLILSGLLRHQVSKVIEVYAQKGMNLKHHLEQGDWAALFFQKGS